MAPEHMLTFFVAMSVPGGRQGVVETIAQRMPLAYLAAAVTLSAAITLFGLYLVVVNSMAREQYAAMVDRAPASDRQALVDAAYARHGNDTLWRQMLWQLVERHELVAAAPEEELDEVAITSEPNAEDSSTLERVRAHSEWVKANPGKLMLSPEHAKPTSSA